MSSSGGRQRERQLGGSGNFVHYLPPPSCLRWCKLGQPTYSPAAIWAMQWHGGKTCPCRCIARFLPCFFFAANSCVRAHTSIEKIPFPSCRAHRLPFQPFNPNNTPPPTRSPLPPTFIRRRVMHVLPGEGWGGGQRRCEGAEERDMMATTTTTTTLPLLQTERTTSACAVEP